MLPRSLTRTEVLDLEHIWLTEFKDKPMPPGGMAELWFQAVWQFMRRNDFEVMPDNVVLGEQQAVTGGLAEEYFASLLEVVDPPEGISDAQKIMLLVCATAEEREVALSRILP